MVICPVCEHAQEPGGECLLCGTRLVEAGASTGDVEPIPELELTRHQAASDFSVARMAELEPTLLEAPATPAALEEAAWIERTACAPSPAMAPPAEPLELEQTAHAPRDAPSRAPFAPLLCRYCRTPAAPGELFCARCGLKLVVYSGAAEVVAPTPEVRRCRFCGFSGSGPTCRACGARLTEA